MPERRLKPYEHLYAAVRSQNRARLRQTGYRGFPSSVATLNEHGGERRRFGLVRAAMTINAMGSWHAPSRAMPKVHVFDLRDRE
jgi:hypothetical protein